MTERLKDQLGRAYSMTLKKHGVPNPVALAERLLDATELIFAMEHEESGIGDVPVDLQELGLPEKPALPYREPRDAPREKPAAEVLAPPSPKNAVIPQNLGNQKATPIPTVGNAGKIILPGDPGFNDAKPADLDKKKILSASAIRRPTRRPSNQPEIPQWNEGDLIDELLKATPEDLVVETQDREGNPKRLTVSRNTHNQAGLGNVLLTYKHAAVSETDGFLIAKHTFSVYDKDVDISAAMDDIRAQLAGQYRAKPQSMEPLTGPDPGPLRLDMRNQPGDYYEANLQSGAAMVENPLNVVKTQVRADNDRLAPAGNRFR